MVEIRVDNRPDFISGKLLNRCERHDVRTSDVERGKPHYGRNGESFNGGLRDEFLTGYCFWNRGMREARSTRRG